MKLYVCWGTFPPDTHPCRMAQHALTEAGHDPEVVRTYSSRFVPNAVNFTRRKVIRLSGGDSTVPLLFTDDGEVVQGSKEIVEWARQNPA